MDMRSKEVALHVEKHVGCILDAIVNKNLRGPCDHIGGKSNSHFEDE